MKKYLFLPMTVIMGAMTFTSCSENDDNGETTTLGDNEFGIVETAPILDQENYPANTAAAAYANKLFGQNAMDGCADLCDELENANAVIGQARLSAEQEAYLRKTLENLVANVIVPTYTRLADDVEHLEATLHGLTTSTITQAQINSACEDFKKARSHWELSEAFLGGAASDFNIDPTIDSWPLNRTMLLGYFNRGGRPEDLNDESILGFHALEFILFRDGQPRRVAEFKGNDTYKGFTAISGAQELKYAQDICTLLKNRTFQLQVAWEGETSANASRVAVVRNAGLDYKTQDGLSFGDNLAKAGVEGSRSSFPNIQAAIAQVLSDDEGSCLGIANEVGTAKIANPFSAGDVSYVESPYSYNSITDFRDNIRSIRNVWLGSTDRTAARYSFHTFFASVSRGDVNNSIENAYVSSIEGISNMPSPFVKYVCTIWNIHFEDAEIPEED